MLDSIIFDMDGLLIDTEIISYQLYSALLAPYGFTVSLHDYAEAYSGKTEEKNVTTLLEHYPLPLSREECFARISAIWLYRELARLRRGLQRQDRGEKRDHPFGALPPAPEPGGVFCPHFGHMALP